MSTPKQEARAKAHELLSGANRFVFELCASGHTPFCDRLTAHLLAEREKLDRALEDVAELKNLNHFCLAQAKDAEAARDGARAALAKVASRGGLVAWGFARGSLKTVQWKCAACDALFRRGGICDKLECSSVIAAAALAHTPPTGAATTGKETP